MIEEITLSAILEKRKAAPSYLRILKFFTAGGFHNKFL